MYEWPIIENASAWIHIFAPALCAEAFPIKANDDSDRGDDNFPEPDFWLPTSEWRVNQG